MSEPIDDGGSAFPFGKKNFTDDWSHGMSLRDWFAGQALEKDIDRWQNKDGGRNREQARFAFADAMLAARKEKQ